MRIVEKCIEKLFNNADAREVSDLRNLLEKMSEDYAYGLITEENIREFFNRNRRYLKYLLESYGATSNLDEAIDEMLNAAVTAAMTKPGKSFSQLYYRERIQKTKEEKRLQLL